MRTTGRVTAIVERYNNDEPNVRFAPRVEFGDANGQTFTFVSRTLEIRDHFRVGQSVKVVYSPDSPQNAEIDSFENRWAVLLVALSVGFACLAIGVRGVIQGFL